MKKSIKMLVLFVIIAIAAVGVVIGFSNLNKNKEKISIIATNFPSYDFARAVAGDKADVKMLVKPGAETHSFEPTPQDIIDIKNSKMFVYVGGESDEWIDNALKDINADQTKLVKMMDIVETVEEETVEGMEHNHEHEEHEHEESEHNHEHEEHEETEYDEHVWTSIKNSIKIINSIKDELVKVSPENKSYFEDNARTYTEKLVEIDNKFQNIVDNASRKTLVFGDRFPLRYFVEDYGLTYYAAFPGCSEQTEASSKTISFLVEKIKTENIPVVLKIEMSNGNIAKTIADETGSKVLEFSAAHNISLDDFNSGLTYAKIMENNLTVLEEALN